MTAAPSHKSVRIVAILAAFFGLCSLILSCVGIGTPNWYLVYNDSPLNTNFSQSYNYFYGCYDNNPSNCTNVLYMGAGYIHERNAGGLALAGILFLAAGILTVLFNTFHYFKGDADSHRHRYFHLVPMILFFVACIAMLAALSEGSQDMLYNGYSANLYQTAHVLAIFALFLSSFVSGRRSLLQETVQETAVIGATVPVSVVLNSPVVQ